MAEKEYNTTLRECGTSVKSCLKLKESIITEYPNSPLHRSLLAMKTGHHLSHYLRNNSSMVNIVSTILNSRRDNS